MTTQEISLMQERKHNCPKHGEEKCFLLCRLGSTQSSEGSLHFCTLTLAWRGDLENIGTIEKG